MTDPRPLTEPPDALWNEDAATARRLLGPSRAWAEDVIRSEHYTRSIPAGKTHWFSYDAAIVAFSIPANPYLARFVLGWNGCVWELSRLWAPDGHMPNLLTQAISASVRQLRRLEPDVDALVSFADPNAGHGGGVYRAASWIESGQSEETRVYEKDGRCVARRAFHSGGRHRTAAEIEAEGFVEVSKPGKLRFVKPVSRRAHRAIARDV